MCTRCLPSADSAFSKLGFWRAAGPGTCDRESPVCPCVATDGAPSLLRSFSAGCASLSGTSLTNNTVFNAVPGRGLWEDGGGSSVGGVGVPRSRAESRHSGTSQGACLLPRTGKHEGLTICLAVLRSWSLAPSALALPHCGARCTYYSQHACSPQGVLVREWHLVILVAQCPRFKNYCPQQPLLSPSGAVSPHSARPVVETSTPASSAVIAAHHRVHLVLYPGAFSTDKVTAPHRALLPCVVAVCPTGLCVVMGPAFIPSSLWMTSAWDFREGRAQAAMGCPLLPCDAACFSIPPAHTAMCSTPHHLTTFRVARALQFRMG